MGIQAPGCKLLYNVALQYWSQYFLDLFRGNFSHHSHILNSYPASFKIAINDTEEWWIHSLKLGKAHTRILWITEIDNVFTCVWEIQSLQAPGVVAQGVPVSLLIWPTCTNADDGHMSSLGDVPMVSPVMQSYRNNSFQARWASKHCLFRVSLVMGNKLS